MREEDGITLRGGAIMMELRARVVGEESIKEDSEGLRCEKVEIVSGSGAGSGERA